MTKTDYVVLVEVTAEGAGTGQDGTGRAWEVAEVLEQQRDPQVAIETAVLRRAQRQGADAADSNYIAVPKRYWRSVPRHVETVTTVVGGPSGG
jgi:hypothetical protein